jgi:hypothetical protein
VVNIRQDQELLAAVDAALDDVRSLNGYRQACQTQRPNTVALRNKYTGEVKLSREDILAHAYAQCRSNKGAPGVDGQDFADHAESSAALIERGNAGRVHRLDAMGGAVKNTIMNVLLVAVDEIMNFLFVIMFGGPLMWLLICSC